MSFDLTAQFVSDFEELRERARNGPGSAAASSSISPPSAQRIRKLETDVKRLEAEVERLAQENSRASTRCTEEISRKNVELDKVRADYAESLESLRRNQVDELSRKEGELATIRAEMTRDVEEAGLVSRRREFEFATKSAGLESRLREDLATHKSELDGLRNSRQNAVRDQVHAEINSSLDELACLSPGMRPAALILDVLLAVLLAATVRFGTPWGRGISEGHFLLAACAVFCLRTFLSPGNLLLGISAREIGPELRPVGRAGLAARLTCGLLHYGPLLAATFFAVTDPSTTRGLMKLLEWTRHPLANDPGLGSVLIELLRPSAPGLPGVVLAITLTWWTFLLLSMVFSSTLHRGTTRYFRNTTLVESMWRVGFQRFSPPQLKAAQVSP